jgi:NAD(P)H-dependent flavin oxidoreductase YrpB (nitropropane dioxygenase family)
VVTEECDAAPAFKQAYIDARREDIGLVRSPVGMPGRALAANVDRIRGFDLDRGFRCSVACLEECAYRDHGSEFCIMEALARAQRGDVETGLVFCGTNAWRAERIGTVREVFEEIFGAEACAAGAAGR